MDMKGIGRFFSKCIMICSAMVMATSCDEDALSSILGDGDTVSALKEALTIGAKTAATNLGVEDGYLADATVKIGLPDEIQTVAELMQTDAGKIFLSAVGASSMQPDSLIVAMNRAAEKAAPESAEIFANAITSMTISDGENILFGANNAATEYLHEKTYSGLQSTFGNVVTSTFSQVQVSGKNLNDFWSSFSSEYNNIVSYKSDTKGKLAMAALKIGLSKAGKSDLYNKIDALETVNTNLGEYVTGKALDGLFLKVADKEADIRTNAASRTSELLKKVFGRLDN